MIEVLRGIASEASAALWRAADSRDALRVEHKGRVDLVTDVDRRLQELVLERLQREFPGERVVAEESDVNCDGGAGGVVWYVDPLDGTTNFVHGHPFSCVSLARWESGRPVLGAVAAPFLDELFLAEAGHGATLERPRAGEGPRRLRASACVSLGQALLATGFPYQRGALARLNLALCAHALSVARGIRRAGSAALDLCYVGAGRLDGYWEMALRPWDVAAGTLVAREAGAVVTDFRGRAEVLEGGRICAAAAGVHRDLLAMIGAGHAHPELDILSAPLRAPVPLSEAQPVEEP